MAYIAKADGSRVLIEDPRTITLEWAQRVVGGGAKKAYVERVCPRLSPNIIFLCNEDGLILNLPFNMHGYKLYGGVIVGDIIVMTRAEAKLAGW